MRLSHLVEAWRTRYRNIYFVHTYSTDLCGLFLERVERPELRDLRVGARLRTPSRRARIRGRCISRISRVVPPQDLQVPALREVDVGGSDDVQVSGFFDKEGGGDHTYRWTGRCASVYLPGARGGDEVVLTTSTGDRPASLPAPVRVSLGGDVLGIFSATPRWSDHALRLPDPLPAGPPVLRLDVPPWRPVNVLPGATDTRDLGVMVDRVRLERAADGRIAVSSDAGGAH